MGTSSYPRMRSGDDHTGTTCGGERSHRSLKGHYYDRVMSLVSCGQKATGATRAAGREL